jgi:hypothetical protein
VWRKLASMTLIVALTVGLSLSSTAGAVSKSTVKARLLTVTDLPPGWTVANTGNGSAGGGAPTNSCLSGVHRPPKGSKKATVTFEREGTVPFLAELLATGRCMLDQYRKILTAVAKCKSLRITDSGKRISASMGQMSFPRLGTTSIAYSLAFMITGVHAGFDLVLFRAKSYVGFVEFGGIGTPKITTVEAFTKEAVAKVEGHPVSPPPTGSGATTTD